MRVLVTGGAGFIGSHLVQRLLARGDRVAVLDDFNDFYDPALKRANLDAVGGHPALAVYEGDIRDRELVSRVMKSEQPAAVVHIAARAGVRPSIIDPDLYLDVNLRGTSVVLQAAHRVGVGHFVFASSSSVYGNDTRAPFREDAAADRPASPYGASKRAGEMLLYAAHSLYGTPVTALRLFTVYGPRCRPDLAVHKFSVLMLKGEPLPLYGDGSAQRDFTFVDDIVQGFERALERPAGFRIVNLGYGHPATVLDLVRLLEQRLGVRARIDFQAPQPGDAHRTYASVEQAGRLLDWRSMTPLEEGLDLWSRWLLSQRWIEVIV